MLKEFINQNDMGKQHEYEEPENLGLDADQSSEAPSLSKLNSDNDRISGNPDGEQDNSKMIDDDINSPLDEK